MKPKTPTKKATKSGQLVVRTSKEDEARIEQLRSRLADPYRGTPNVADTVRAAIKIAHDVLVKENQK